MIYDCVIAPEHWSAVMEVIRLEFQFANAILSVHALPALTIGLHAIAGLDPVWSARLSEYGAEASEMWGGAARFDQFPLAEPIINTTAIRPGQLTRNRYFTEWVEPQGLIDAVMLILARDPSMIAALTFGRHRSAGDVGESEAAGLRLVGPHIRRAVAISKIFELKTVEATTFSSTIEAVSAGVVLVGEDLAIVHANSAAEMMLRAKDPILSRQGRLGLVRQVANGALEAALFQSLQDEAKIGQRGTAVPLRRADGVPCVLHLLPLGRGEIRPGLVQCAAAAIFIVPAAAPPRLPSDALTLLYDLTPAETRIFELVCDGKTQREIASLLGIAPSTVKTHLLRVFDKTGCGRQAELVKLAASFTLPLW